MTQNNLYVRKANYYETDQMGIVHHSNYIRYFEEARLSFMDGIGCNAAQMEADGIIIPNVDIYARYERPVRFNDEVTIEVQLIKFNGATMRYAYTVRNSSGETAATGHSTHCFVDKAFKPMTLKRRFPGYYQTLKNHIVKEETTDGKNI